MKLKALLPTALLGVSGATLAGLMAMQAPTVDAGEVAKRDEDGVELVLVGDDDDDDTNDWSRSRETNDHTRSNFTKVSRDRDRSRGDKTRDWTRDGKRDHKKRDWSANKTNDRSRNDTRR